MHQSYPISHKALIYNNQIIKNHMMETCLLSDIIQRSRGNDVTYFDSLWSSTGQQLSQTLQFLSRNWDSLFPFYQQQLETFQDLLDSKIQSIQDYEKLFPGLVQVIKRLEHSNEYKGSYKKMYLQQPVTDLLMKHYINDVSSRKQRSGIYYVRDQVSGQKVALDDYIANHRQYRGSQIYENRWQSTFNKIQHKLGTSQQKVLQSEYVKEIQNERLMPVNCLGCCPFFYTGCNIKDPLINSTPLIVLSSVSRIRQLQNRLKDEVCLLLNAHGGVIMFDCTMRGREVIPVGDIMSLHLKDEISQTISSYLQAIYPPLEPANITISFVPMIKNPLQGSRIGKRVIFQGCYEDTYFQREYIEGVYVTRIKVNPTVPERVYFWANDQRPIFPMHDGNQITSTPGRKIRKMIKQRFKKYYVVDNDRDADELRFLSPRLSYFHDGQCLRPQLGIQVANLPQIKNPLDTYKHMSLMMARKADLATIKARLHKHGIACQIQNKFEQYRFKFSINTALIYHNTRFDVLLAEVSHKKEFQFGGKYLTLLCVTPFIKLSERNARAILPEEDFSNIHNFFSKEFPPQSLKLWRYSCDGEVEFYFRTGSRMQTIFLFYILNHLGERAMLKNPKNFDKLTMQDINKRFQLFYPRHQENLQNGLKIQLKVKPQ